MNTAKDQTNMSRYLETYSGKELVKKHSLDEIGIWQVYGEDPNCDMGGAHHQPELGLFSGKLRNVIVLAVNLKNFYTWGGGGTIKKVEVKTAEHAMNIERRKKEIQDEIEKLQSELKILQ